MEFIQQNLNLCYFWSYFFSAQLRREYHSASHNTHEAEAYTI